MQIKIISPYACEWPSFKRHTKCKQRCREKGTLLQLLVGLQIVIATMEKQHGDASEN